MRGLGTYMRILTVDAGARFLFLCGEEDLYSTAVRDFKEHISGGHDAEPE